MLVLDGGTGTHLQALGAPMSGETWCADANLTHPDLVQKVHREFLAAGARMVTTNTFATSPLLFDQLGRLGEVPHIDRRATELARAAVGDLPVAGSFSTMRVVTAGSDRTDRRHDWPEVAARSLFRLKTDGLVAAGVDLIVMEMMRDADYSLWATEEALAGGRPVWIGISVERVGGELVGFGRPDQPLARFGPRLAALGPAAIAVMHSSVTDTEPALAEVRRWWDGPLAVYPESGYFAMPDWQFVDIIPEAEFVSSIHRWNSMFELSAAGGCCGIGPAHIAALAASWGG